MSKKPTVLMILDGYGLRDKTEGNAVALANTPVMDKLMAECPFVKGNASGLAVGLPDGQMGNSEVGHMNMGAGRIIYQELTKITKSIEDGEFFENKALLAACENVKKNDSALHLMGLVSDGGVHSHITHIYGILELAKRQGIEKVYVHCFLDGRDTPPASGKEYVEQLEAKMKEIGVGEVASVSGRYYAMDRDNRWDRVEKAYKALVAGEGNTAESATAGIQASYDEDVTDEFVVPFVVTKDGAATATIKENDSVVFFNFRPDRAREITRAFCADEFDGFAREKKLDLTYVCFTQYDATIPHTIIAFKKVELHNTFGEYLAAHHMTQARIAETEKYAHVTFFFNGGENTSFPGEEDVCVPSPKGIDFDQKPELSLPEVARTVAGALGKYDFIVTNFANGDVIGHTQNTAAKLDACGYVSRALEQVVDAALAQDYVVAITADHGNIEKLYTVAGKPDGSHTTNLVPFILIDSRQEDPISLRDGALCDVAPTILDVMGLPQPLEMTGRSLAEGHAWSRGRRMLLIICDGWGLGAGDEGDAIHLAHTPYWDALLENRSWCRLQASREFVGLGAGKAGNAEAGHSNLGAGRCVMQDDVRLDAAVQDGSFARNPVFLEAIEHARRNHASLHLLAYLTHKSSHGCIDYPLAICEMAKKQGLEEVYFHIIFDGRSTEPGSAPALLAELDSRLDQIGLGRIVDGVGRGVVLDRDKNYDKVKRAYDALTDGLGAWYS